MLDFTVRFVGVYREADTFVYYPNGCGINFVVGGYDRYREPGCELTDGSPFISVFAENTRMECSFNRNRENWVIMMRSDDIRPAETLEMIELKTDDTWVSLPKITPLTPEEVPRWQREMHRLRDACLRPDGRSRLRVKTGAMNVIRFLLDRRADALDESPAGKLKRLIEEDEAGMESITALSRKCRYSSDHLRRLFEKEYGLTPGNYRALCRMSRAMDLVSNSELSVKEISQRVGFAHVSHFSTAFRKHFDMTPSAGIRRFRRASARPA